jgi:hypothetical protein
MVVFCTLYLSNIPKFQKNKLPPLSGDVIGFMRRPKWSERRTGLVMLDNLREFGQLQLREVGRGDRIVPGQWQLRILKTTPFSGILSFHCLGTILFPLSAFQSCDWPNILKLSYVTSRFLSPYHFNIHLKAIQSPWDRWSMFFWSVETFNCYTMQESKDDHHLLNHHRENLKTPINFFLTSFSLRR